MVLGGEAFGRYLGHEGGVLMNGINDLIKRPQSTPSLPLLCKDIGRRWSSMNQEIGPQLTMKLPAS